MRVVWWPRYFLFVFALFSFSFLPMQVSARVYISEVAWMGSKTDTGTIDANDEWIELYNDGEERSLVGWSLTWEGGRSAVLPARIPANSTLTLCRTNGGLSGALNNTGQTLVLADAEGKNADGEGDRVDGANGWKIEGVLMGNNTTKETMQRGGEPPTGAWTTGTPSRGMCAEVATSLVGGGTTVSTTNGADGGGILLPTTETERLRRLSFSFSGQKRYEALVGVPILFSTEVKDASGRAVPARLVWSFGDGASAEGKEVSHVYAFVGTYTVSLFGDRTAFGVVASTSETRTVVVREKKVRVVSADSVAIELENMTNNSLDLGGAVLLGGGKSFVFPKHTLLASGASVRFPQSITKVSGEAFALVQGGVLLAFKEGLEKTIDPKETQIQKNIRASTKQQVFLDKNGNESVREEKSEEVTPTFTKGKEVGVGKMWTGVFVVGLLTLLVVVSIFLMRREEAEVVEGYTIVDKEDSK